MSEAENTITVEVAYAIPDKQRILQCTVSSDSHPVEVVRNSGLLEVFPEINLDTAKIGIWGKLLTNQPRKLKQGDRIEIYRPLITDPKTARLNRARRSKNS